MEKFIHRENLALYRRRLEEPHTDAEREVLLRLLAEEERKEAHSEKEQQPDLMGKLEKEDGCS
jgi:hypothetical protein